MVTKSEPVRITLGALHFFDLSFSVSICQIESGVMCLEICVWIDVISGTVEVLIDRFFFLNNKPEIIYHRA